MLRRLLVFEAFSVSVYLAVYSAFCSTLFLAHLLLDEWSVLTSFPMRRLPRAASVQVSWSLLMSSLCEVFFGKLHKNRVFLASAPSVSLALYLFPFRSTGVLAHILSQQWPVLPFFPMSFFLQATSSQDGFCICYSCQISFFALRKILVIEALSLSSSALYSPF